MVLKKKNSSSTQPKAGVGVSGQYSLMNQHSICCPLHLPDGCEGRITLSSLCWRKELMWIYVCTCPGCDCDCATHGFEVAAVNMWVASFCSVFHVAACRVVFSWTLGVNNHYYSIFICPVLEAHCRLQHISAFQIVSSACGWFNRTCSCLLPGRREPGNEAYWTKVTCCHLSCPGLCEHYNHIALAPGLTRELCL